MKKQICSICQAPYKEFGNNAQPVNKGRCCDECNTTVVVLARVNIIIQKQNEILKKKSIAK